MCHGWRGKEGGREGGVRGAVGGGREGEGKGGKGKEEIGDRVCIYMYMYINCVPASLRS